MKFPRATRRASPELEHKARRRCLAAFLADLKGACARHPAVILIDDYDQWPKSLAAWIDNFIRTHALAAQPPNKLIVVVAGKVMPPFQKLAPERVNSKENLSWEREHVRDFLRVNGLTQLTERRISFICDEVVESGWSISFALKMAHAFQMTA